MTDTAPLTGPPEAGAHAKPVPGWAVHRRLYNWTLSLAHRKHATTALFLLSFAESSFFPIPPDVLQIALTLERRGMAWFYASVSTIASVLGGVAGWLIGLLAWEAISPYVLDRLPGLTSGNFATVQRLFEENAFWAIFTAAFTPIPYKVFTVGAGVFGISLPVLIVASALGRGGRFFLVAGLMWFFGPPVKRLIERYFDVLSLAFTAVLIGAFVLLKYL